ncbi:hypothetical protein VMT65_12460 [Nocardia sp. CDC153]|uniref:hypothetical protein n=1 Tax=Nocardia sp. CDC153 TaxID=3112167 RepID=UPI002DB8B641|nr:hypothetical protein [Nocardia sp. CDC153]MEC3953842.1 hypothetical protein [Nocardia sp. CDC153]
MIARIAVWEPMPEDDRDWVMEAVSAVDGFVAAYHLKDPDTGNGLSISLFTDDLAADTAGAAVAERARAIGWYETPRPAPVSVTHYEVTRTAAPAV